MVLYFGIHILIFSFPVVYIFPIFTPQVRLVFFFTLLLLLYIHTLSFSLYSFHFLRCLQEDEEGFCYTIKMNDWQIFG